MPYLVPILHVIASYCLLIIPTSLRPTFNVDLILFCFPFVLGIVNLIIVLTAGRKWSRETMMNCAMIVKYGLIPFYLFGGLVAVIVTALALFPLPLMQLFMLVTAVFVASGYFLLLASAPYTISYLIKARKDGLHSTGGTILAGICQFLFVFDVASLMIFSLKDRHRVKTTIAALIVTALMILLIAALIINLFALA